MMHLTPAQVEELAPGAFGWEASILIPLREFPEIQGRRMVQQRDAYQRGSERLVIEWDRDWNLLALARNGVWVERMSWVRLQLLVLKEIPQEIDGETAQQFLSELCDFELCADCAGDADDHIAIIGPLGKWHALCLFETPEDCRISIRPEMKFQGKTVRSRVYLERKHSDEVISSTYVLAGGEPRERFARYFDSALEPEMSEAEQEAAQDVLREYRTEQHNKR
ncbi:hypothetical protein [Streptomyces sp. NPDC017448]|uniref:hypothetical protein n=1 Tax=Streptomyces sp. NPDC017448 TaxID=3364996 RepID=UPI0037B45660